jgi:hypothetical protein
MIRNHASVLGCAGLVGALLFSAPGQCREAAPKQKLDIQQLKRLIEEQAKKLEQQKRALMEQETELAAQRRVLEEMRQRLAALQAPPPAENKAQAMQTAQQQPSRNPQAEQPAPPPAGPVGRAPEPPKESKPPQVAPIFDQPGVLTPRGKFVVEPSLQYAYATSNRVSLVGYTIIPAITIGLIDIRTVNRSTWIAALTGRYGITNRLEVEARLPYVYREDSTVARPFGVGSEQDTVFNASGNGIGDVEVTARYQFNDGGVDRPFYIGSLRLKSRTGEGPFDVQYSRASSLATGLLQETLPTGSGFYGIQPGLTVIYPSDPAVFFGSVNYLWNIKRDVNKNIGGAEIGNVDPGDVFTFNFGMGLALNERASFSLGYEHSRIGKDKFNFTEAPAATATQLGTLLLGYSYRLSDKTTVNLSLGAGLTEATPDIQLTLRVPMTF